MWTKHSSVTRHSRRGSGQRLMSTVQMNVGLGPEHARFMATGKSCVDPWNTGHTGSPTSSVVQISTKASAFFIAATIRPAATQGICSWVPSLTMFTTWTPRVGPLGTSENATGEPRFPRQTSQRCAAFGIWGGRRQRLRANSECHNLASARLSGDSLGLASPVEF